MTSPAQRPTALRRILAPGRIPGRHSVFSRRQIVKISVYRGTDSRTPVFILGYEFGPCLLTIDATCEDALSEFDEQFGHRVDTDDSALLDYPGADIGERFESAMNDGSIRINDGGTLVWVSDYEWIREFADTAAAEKFIREFSPCSEIEFAGDALSDK